MEKFDFYEMILVCRAHRSVDPTAEYVIYIFSPAPLLIEDVLCAVNVIAIFPQTISPTASNALNQSQYSILLFLPSAQHIIVAWSTNDQGSVRRTQSIPRKCTEYKAPSRVSEFVIHIYVSKVSSVRNNKERSKCECVSQYNYK